MLIPAALLGALILIGALGAAFGPSPSKNAADSVAASPTPATTPVSTRPTSPTPATAGHIVINAAGAALPDPRVTPGALNSKVTQGNINSTICASGYSASIRPTVAYTAGIKTRQLRTGYSYESDTAPGDYEEDHLVSLELGGSPTSVANLWPEPYGTTDGAHAKDKIEDKLHSLVCGHRITLAAAQHDIAANWYATYQHYVVAPATAAASRSAAASRAAAARRAAAASRSAAASNAAAASKAAHRRSASSAAAQPPTTSCTETSTGKCIQGGEFCPQADYGQDGTDANGTVYTCTGDSTHPHWE